MIVIAFGESLSSSDDRGERARLARIGWPVSLWVPNFNKINPIGHQEGIPAPALVILPPFLLAPQDQ